MILSSHVCPKFIEKGLKIDIGDQAMLREVFEAGLELSWASFGSQIDTFGDPGSSNWARWNWNLALRQPLDPSWCERGLLAPPGRAQERSGGVQLNTNGSLKGSKIRAKSLQDLF